jgi:hypothetical protein
MVRSLPFFYFVFLSFFLLAILLDSIPLSPIIALFCFFTSPITFDFSFFLQLSARPTAPKSKKKTIFFYYQLHLRFMKRLGRFSFLDCASVGYLFVLFYIPAAFPLGN